MGRIVIWIVCLALLSLVYVAAIHFKADDIETDLKDRSNLALLEKNISWANITVNGRDANLSGIAPELESVKKVKAMVLSVWGIRIVECQCPIFQKIIPSDGHIEPETTPTAYALPTIKPKLITEPLNNNRESVTETKEHNPVDPCQENMNDLLKNRSIEFGSGSSTISRESYSLLEELMSIIQSCPGKRIKISGHTDNVGSVEKNRSLSLDRAEAVLSYFKHSGIATDRFKVLGYGDSSPRVSNDTDENRKRNRRIEFHITP